MPIFRHTYPYKYEYIGVCVYMYRCVCITYRCSVFIACSVRRGEKKRGAPPLSLLSLFVPYGLLVTVPIYRMCDGHGKGDVLYRFMLKMDRWAVVACLAVSTRLDACGCRGWLWWGGGGGGVVV